MYYNGHTHIPHWINNFGYPQYKEQMGDHFLQ